MSTEQNGESSFAPDQMAEEFTDSKAKKAAIGALLAVLVLALVGTVVGVIWMTATGNTMHGEPLTTEAAVEGIIGPDTPIGASGKPYVDHSFRVSSPGAFSIVATSEDPETVRPVVSILSGTQMLTNGIAAQGSSAARVVHDFQRPGDYTVRVTTYDIGATNSAVGYVLRVDPRS